jgi:hypothetical protein
MNCGRPTAPAKEPSRTTGSMPDLRASSRVFSSSLRKKACARLVRRVRIGEGQRGQGVEHAEAAGVAAVHGFHADDADDDLGRHAVGRFGPRQRGGVLVPEAHAGIDADRLDEALRCRRQFFGLPGGAGLTSCTADSTKRTWRIRASSSARAKPCLATISSTKSAPACQAEIDLLAGVIDVDTLGRPGPAPSWPWERLGRLGAWPWRPWLSRSALAGHACAAAAQGGGCCIRREVLRCTRVSSNLRK